MLATLSNSKIHQRIDSLRITIKEVEVTLPYSNKGYFIPIPLLFRAWQEVAVGPSRIRIQLEYDCYHNGLVTQNNKLFQTTVSSQYNISTRSGENVDLRIHIQTVYDVLNELLSKASLAIREELESEL
jgi:hypothetical protein